MKAAVYLHPTKLNVFRKGHPWIFPKAITTSKGNLKTGGLVDIYSPENAFLGVGIYNEHSLYRVRVLAYAFENLENYELSTILMHRLKQAIDLRNAINLPNESTTAYRFFNSEADGLSGLTIDRFNNTLVISSSAYWVEKNKELIISQLQSLLPQVTILWFPQEKALKQDGFQLVDSNTVSAQEEIMEEGIRFVIDFSNTQKTGLFLDQRENHHRLASLAKNKKVLDLYTYTGGFALHAAKAGAERVVGIDSSAQAIELAQKNANNNQLKNIEFLVGDARNYLTKASEFDIVILDPPKLVPSQRHLERAKNYYRFLHREVFNVMKSGSLLMTCNCSAALSASEFAELVSNQAFTVGKMVRILGIYGPARCHPVLASFPEGHYLTAILLLVL
ncbi:SAM-dependent methyltransferase (plasmid) [Legionella adelaidensis]|uniref:SAM-dependent methyltransferase n=1 Tax=Legionella adelaidensis TaxID=45056 RepID=A0A0W0R401_9GAMM|nr:class I SAM-dependent rRNA methyltransferase [Legionella adelaidensis]KTC65800.1 SAM-dependent methyltransferase [Legionella adelaidensis]VEH85228.1 SAM-dependent methyltransferase [Legionella adelaidensis]